MKICIIGGVAGGASFAARLRRLDEKAQITIYERGEFVSFANCGLPYHLSGVIRERGDLILKTPEDFKKNYNILVKTGHEVIRIIKDKKLIKIKEVATGRVFEDSYDKLLLSPGAKPYIPQMEGYHPSLVHTLRTIPDMDAIIAHIANQRIEKALVIGGGFIGVEVAENLHEKGIKTSLVEFADQVMVPFDREMANILHGELQTRGIDLHLQDSVKSIQKISEDLIKVTLQSGKVFETNMIVSAVGVLPETDLAKEANLELGLKGAILVNEHMQSSDPDIYAVGDAVEVVHFLGKQKTLLPLAGPAAKQARVAANHIMGIKTAEPKVQGTAIVKVFSLTAAVTGLNEKFLKKSDIPYQVIMLHPFDHVGYYPGARQMALKIIYHKDEETILGAQAIGASGVDKRIDVLATAIRAKMKVTELQELELCYAPPYGSSKDAINMAGFVADNIKNNLVKFVSSKDLEKYPNAFYLDVRTPEEYSCGHIHNAINIPLYELRSRINEIPKDKMIIVNCAVGIRAYNAISILQGSGYANVFNLSGGYKSFSNENFMNNSKTPSCISNSIQNKSEERSETVQAFNIEIDLTGLQCPGPILALKKKLDISEEGIRIKVKASDIGFIKDISAFCESTGHKLISNGIEGNTFTAVIEKKSTHPCKEKATPDQNKKTIVVFSGDLDKALATFIIANGARAMGSDVTLFFTFWGLNILRDPKKFISGKTFLEAMFGMMMPKGASKLKLSKMNLLGMGTLMMKYIMNKKKVNTLESLIHEATQSGIHLVACSMSMDVMGIKKEELINGVEIGGVGHYLGNAEQSNLNLFI